MYLIYEKNDLAVAVHDFLDHTLEPFLELALILGARDEGTQVEGIYLLGLQVLRDLAVNNLLRDTFRNGRLAHARFSDQYRVVLRPSAQYLQHTPDFVIPTDDRIKLSGSRPFIKVDCKFL